MLCAMVSPVASAAAKITVDSISPSTISTDCARRRGMLRRPMSKRIGWRHRTQSTEASTPASRTSRTPSATFIGMPKNSLMPRHGGAAHAPQVRLRPDINSPQRGRSRHLMACPPRPGPFTGTPSQEYGTDREDGLAVRPPNCYVVSRAYSYRNASAMGMDAACRDGMIVMTSEARKANAADREDLHPGDVEARHAARHELVGHDELLCQQQPERDPAEDAQAGP